LIDALQSDFGKHQGRGVVVISINTSWNIVNFRSSLVRALIAEGLEVVALAPRDPFSPRIEALGCRYIELPMDNKGTSFARDFGLMMRYRRLLRELRPVVYLGYTIKPNVYGTLAARSLGIPTINNISGLGTAFIRENWLTRVVHLLYRVALAGSYKVFFQNADDRALFVDRGLVATERTDVLPGSGIDLDWFVPRERTTPRDEKAPLFLMIARLLWDKGVREYVDAARIVRAKFPDARFQLVGPLDVENRTAVHRASVEAWVSEGVIDYLGPLDDVRPVIADADCVVLPSYREGAPRTLIEAQAMGRPVITTDVPGCRDVIEAGVTGLMCRVKDAADLAGAMETLAEMSREARGTMGVAARRLMVERFDEKIVIRAYLDAVRGPTGSQNPHDGV
jgi:glycosyltransferase involved in cell wall biosynthesis